MNILHVFSPLRTIVALTFAILLSVGAAASVSERLVAGSVDIAQRRLAVRIDDRSGLDLLLFALAVSPENREALLLQARLERGLPIQAPEQAEDAKAFLAFLEALVKRTASPDRQLLLYKIIELVDPANETALLELTRAKNQGVDVSFESLIKCLNPAGGQPSPTGVASATAGGEELRPPTAIGGAQRLQEAVANLRVSRNVLTGGVMRTLSHIDSAALRPAGGILEYRSSRHPATAYSSGGNMTYYSSSSGLGYGHEFQRTILPMARTELGGDVGALEWLRELAAVYNLEIGFTDHSLLITDAAEGTGISNGAAPIDASVLCAELDKGVVNFIRKYRGRRVFLKGRFSGVGRSMRDHYAEMESGKVRILLDGGVDQWRIDQLKERNYQGWQLYVIAECEGVSGGRIMFRKCRFVGW